MPGPTQIDTSKEMLWKLHGSSWSQNPGRSLSEEDGPCPPTLPPWKSTDPERSLFNNLMATGDL